MEMHKRFVCCLLAGTIMLGFCGCQKEAKNNFEFSENGKSDNSYFVSADTGRLPFLYEVYPLTADSSMVLAELKSVGEVLSDDPSLPAIYSDYLMVEFRIIEDYYKKLPENTVITVPVKLNVLNESAKVMNLSDVDEENAAAARLTNNAEADFENEATGMDMDSTGGTDGEREALNSEILSNFLNENNRAILFLRFVYESRRWYRNRNWKDIVTLNCVSCGVRLPENYIPVNNEIVEFNGVLNFLDENNCSYNSPNDIYDFSSFIYDGMSLSAAKENIRELYRTQLKNSAE